jgi:hypothetical protein
MPSSRLIAANMTEAKNEPKRLLRPEAWTLGPDAGSDGAGSLCAAGTSQHARKNGKPQAHRQVRHPRLRIVPAH